MTAPVTLRPATAGDLPGIRALLERDGLPTSDLATSACEFVAACRVDELVGAGALEHYGATALLRSLAVAGDHRRAGVGRMIVRELEARARSAGVTELVLLTQTAAGFFEREGYRAIGRQAVDPAVQASEQFRSLCPSSATCMAKTLR